MYAFEEAAKETGNDTAYFAGYMGGELLMGIYYDNLVFTKFLTDLWENRTSQSDIKSLVKQKLVETISLFVPNKN